jgi:hypothetical protein
VRPEGRGPRCLVLVGSFSLVLAFVLSASAAAQGLGAAAARERERREKTQTPAARVLTNDDLPSGVDSGGETEGSSDAVGDEGTTTSVDPSPEPVEPVREELDREREKRALAEREWRARFAEARARVREAEARCWQEVVRTEFHKGIPVQMKVKEFVETEEYRQTKKNLADLQEAFRRTGLPPGWARE